MAARVGPPTAANSFNKHEGIVKAKRGNGVVFSESASGSDPGRVWHLSDRKSGVKGTVLAEGDFSKMSRPDNLRYDRSGNLLIFEDNGSALDTNPATGGNNEVYVLPKGTDGLGEPAQVRHDPRRRRGHRPVVLQARQAPVPVDPGSGAARRLREPRARDPRPEGTRPRSARLRRPRPAGRRDRPAAAPPRRRARASRPSTRARRPARPPSPAARRARRATPARAARPPRGRP